MHSQMTCCVRRSFSLPAVTMASWLTSGWSVTENRGRSASATPGSTSVNTDRPERVYLETAQKLIAMLTRLIDDPEYNRAEQLREFEAHWEILCRNGTGGLTELFVSWDGHEVQRLQVKPPRATSGSALRKNLHRNGERPATAVGVWDRGLGIAADSRESAGGATDRC